MKSNYCPTQKLRNIIPRVTAFISNSNIQKKEIEKFLQNFISTIKYENKGVVWIIIIIKVVEVVVVVVVFTILSSNYYYYYYFFQIFKK